jgi:hypothetical protein
MDAGRVQTAERREVGLVALQWRSSSRHIRGCARGVLEALRRKRFPAQPGRCKGMDSDCTDGCQLLWVCSYIYDNAGLCGTVVPLSSGRTFSTTGTALGSGCPTFSPTITYPVCTSLPPCARPSRPRCAATGRGTAAE